MGAPAGGERRRDRREAARLSPRTVNRMLTGVVGFYELQARRGQHARQGPGRCDAQRPRRLQAVPARDRARRPRGRAGRLPETEALPRTLTLEQVAAVVDAQSRLRDRFLFALLASTGMRIGQALALRHEDIVAWERRIEIRAREGERRRARTKGGAEGAIPVGGELMRLWSDYMHEEYRDLDSDFVFVNLWGGQIGRPMSYANVDDIVGRTRRKVGFHVHRAPVAPHLRDAGVPRRRRAGGHRRAADAPLADVDADLHPSHGRRSAQGAGAARRSGQGRRPRGMTAEALRVLDGGRAPRGWEALWAKDVWRQSELPHGDLASRYRGEVHDPLRGLCSRGSRRPRSGGRARVCSATRRRRSR